MWLAALLDLRGAHRAYSPDCANHALRDSMRYGFSLFAILLLLFGARPALANSDNAEPTAGMQVRSNRALTPAEKAEKKARKACKIEICDILATKAAQGPDIACDIVKTWRTDDIVEMLGGRIDWPWGSAVCKSKLRLKRAPLAKAMSEPHARIVMESQSVRCSLLQKEGKPYVVELDMAPKVTFENGKAVSAEVNWGEVSAPMLIYPILYAGTGLDNSSNVLGPEVVRMVNEFTGKKCAEVRRELPSNQPN